ncbi:2-amino-4-hydroxy-6-hydroxymethyldihydropteridine diphosphokinase [Aurantivibrio plasticivorans]
MVDVYVGLGSNCNRVENIERALDALRKLDSNLITSKFYESASHSPVAGQHPSPYYNGAAKLTCEYSPEKIKSVLTDIENALGRNRQNPAVVTMDIDLLLYGDLVITTPALNVPHPDLLQYRHVLLPIAELAPGVVHPVSKVPLQQLLGELPDQRSLFHVDFQSA